eukprot:862147-Prymnesium_polylepis.1
MDGLAWTAQHEGLQPPHADAARRGVARDSCAGELMLACCRAGEPRMALELLRLSWQRHSPLDEASARRVRRARSLSHFVDPPR